MARLYGGKKEEMDNTNQCYMHQNKRVKHGAECSAILLHNESQAKGHSKQERTQGLGGSFKAQSALPIFLSLPIVPAPLITVNSREIGSTKHRMDTVPSGPQSVR